MQSTRNIIRDLWLGVDLPLDLLAKHTLHLIDEDQHVLQSSYRIGALAQATIAATALAASLYRHLTNGSRLDEISVGSRHAAIEFARLSPADDLSKSVPSCSKEFRAMLDLPANTPSTWDELAGYYICKDGKYIRLHTNWPHHKLGLLRILRVNEKASRKEVEGALLNWNAEDLEKAAREAGMCATMYRSSEEWYSSEMGKSVQKWLQENKGCPIKISKINGNSNEAVQHHFDRSLRVIDMSRVIAAPVAGRVLANHGANVLLVSCLRLPNLPILELDTARGKRATDLDLDTEAGKANLMKLIEDCDVFMQSYRPGALAERGFSPEKLIEIRSGLIYAELDAYGFEGPWKNVRGFDSLVQSASGINESEAKSYRQYIGSPSEVGEILPPRPLPCQALDHASGYLLAFGTLAAKCRALLEKEGVAGWHVQVSLAATAAWLESLGKKDGEEAWKHPCPIDSNSQEVLKLLEPYDLRGCNSSWQILGIKHSASNHLGDRKSVPFHRDLDELKWEKL